MDVRTLEKLKAKGFAHPSMGDLGVRIMVKKDGDGKLFEKQGAIMRAAFRKYMKIFAKPDLNKSHRDHRCICCETDLTGILGEYEWGIAHGEGRCGNCGYPHRAKHTIKSELGSLEVPFFPLPYHPDQLELRDPEKEEEDGDSI